MGEIGLFHHTGLNQCVEIDDAAPETLVKQHDGKFLNFSGELEIQDLEQFVERPKTAWEHDKRIGPHHQMHLAHREIMEAEGQIRRAIGIWRLFMRQGDVEPDRRRTGIGRPAVRGFHEAGAATRGNHMLMDIAIVLERTAPLGRDPAEMTGFLIPEGLWIGAFFTRLRGA